MQRNLYITANYFNLDCSNFFTGSEVRAVGWDSEKAIQSYNLVVKRDCVGSSIIPLASYMSNTQYDYEIGHFLECFTTRYTKLTNATNIPVKIMITDMSRAMLNAVLGKICKIPNLIDYLQACIDAKQCGRLNFPIVVWCYAHLSSACKRRAEKLVPSSKKPFSPARRFMKTVVASLARTSELETARPLFQLAVMILNSKDYTPHVERLVGSIALRYFIFICY